MEVEEEDIDDVESDNEENDEDEQIDLTEELELLIQHKKRKNIELPRRGSWFHDNF